MRWWPRRFVSLLRAVLRLPSRLAAYEQEIGSVEEEPRQRTRLETLGKAGLLWADPLVPKKQVIAETGLDARELRRLFGRRRRPPVCDL